MQDAINVEFAVRVLGDGCRPFKGDQTDMVVNGYWP